MRLPQFTIRDLMWLTLAVAAFCAGTQLDRYWEQHRGDPRDASIRAALDQKTDIKFIETPFHGVVDDLKQRHGIEIQLDRRALDNASIPTNTPITRSIKGVTLRSALNLLLDDLDLTYAVQNGVMMITTEAEAQKLRSKPFGFQIAMWLAAGVVGLWGLFLGRRAWRRGGNSNLGTTIEG